MQLLKVVPRDTIWPRRGIARYTIAIRYRAISSKLWPSTDGGIAIHIARYTSRDTIVPRRQHRPVLNPISPGTQSAQTTVSRGTKIYTAIQVAWSRVTNISRGRKPRDQTYYHILPQFKTVDCKSSPISPFQVADHITLKLHWSFTLVHLLLCVGRWY